MAQNKTLKELGNIMIAEVGESVCINSYESADPVYVGRMAIAYGDINEDGTLN